MQKQLNIKTMLQLIKEELIAENSLTGMQVSLEGLSLFNRRLLLEGANIEANMKYKKRLDFALRMLDSITDLHRLYKFLSGACCISVTQTDTGDVIFCTAEQLEQLNEVSWQCINTPIYNVADLSICERFNEQTFEDLNKPTTDTDLDTSVWGDDGSMGNNEADKQALSEFGVYFNVLIFLDGSDTFYRTTKED